jgi:hypothetical protein
MTTSVIAEPSRERSMGQGLPRAARTIRDGRRNNPWPGTASCRRDGRCRRGRPPTGSAVRNAPARRGRERRDASTSCSGGADLPGDFACGESLRFARHQEAERLQAGGRCFVRVPLQPSSALGPRGREERLDQQRTRPRLILVPVASLTHSHAEAALSHARSPAPSPRSPLRALQAAAASSRAAP